MKKIGLKVIGSKPTGKKMVVKAPYDQSVLAEVETGTAVTIEKALATSYSLFKDKATWLSLAERLAVLEKVAQLMQNEFESLAVSAAREGGKPLVDSRIEVARAIDGVQLCVETMRAEGGTYIPMNSSAASANKVAFTTKEPIGVVIALSAFNHPLNLIVHQVAPAVATGCPVIVKPAGKTPLSCFRFVDFLYEAGLPKEWCQAIALSDNGLATQLATDSRVAFLSFIGSSKVGWMLRSKLAPGTRCALEHGGVAPVIVCGDGHIEDAIPKLVKGGFYHSGQVCVSVQRIFVHSSLVKEVTKKLSHEATKLVAGDPTLESTDIGPLIDPLEVDRVHSWVEEAIAEGAEIITGGQKLNNNCYAPTVVLNPPDDVQLSCKEVFGPVVCIYEFDDLDEAVKRANQLPYAFQAAVFTKNIDTALKLYRGLNGSAIMVNEHTAFRVDWMPFSGLNNSGMGIGGIPHTISDMQIEKMLVVHSSEI